MSSLEAQKKIQKLQELTQKAQHQAVSKQMTEPDRELLRVFELFEKYPDGFIPKEDVHKLERLGILPKEPRSYRTLSILLAIYNLLFVIVALIGVAGMRSNDQNTRLNLLSIFAGVVFLLIPRLIVWLRDRDQRDDRDFVSLNLQDRKRKDK